MAWNAKNISVVAGLLALLTEAGLNNSLILGLVYAAASSVAAPVLVHQIVVAHNAAEARMAADRRGYASARGGRQSASEQVEPGDTDQKAKQTDVGAPDSPDMPRRLGPMLVARRVFLAEHGSDPALVRPILGEIDHMLSDDQKAFASFARHGERDPASARAHRADLAALHEMDGQLGRLRASAAPAE